MIETIGMGMPGDDTYETDGITSDEGEVLYHLHRCIGPRGERLCNEEVLAHVQEDFKHCEAHTMYELYQAGAVPRLQDMRTKTQALLAKVEADVRASEEDKRDARELWKLVGGSLPSAVSRYVQSVIVFVQKSQDFRMMDALERREFVKHIDGDRRVKHDALIKVLRDISDRARHIVDELGALDSTDVLMWRPGMDITGLGACVIFDGAFIDPADTRVRNMIKNWAIAADFDRYIGAASADQKA